QLKIVEITEPAEIAPRIAVGLDGTTDAVMVIPSAMFWNRRQQVLATLAKSRVPAIFPEREYADDGGLLAYGTDVEDNFRGAAEYVDKILKGSKPADLPIVQPKKF